MNPWLGVIIFAACCVFIWNVAITPLWNQYVIRYDKPWWSGTQSQRVCDAFDSTKCYHLAVTSNGDSVISVSWPNGGQLAAMRSSCAKSGSAEVGADRFCTIVDQRDVEWDIFPN